MALWARSQDFFGQLRGFFNEFGTKRGGRPPPPLDPRLPVKSLIRNGVISGSGSGVCAGCGAQWLGRGWMATGSTIGVAWVNGHHPYFLSTWICHLKQVTQQLT